MEEGGGGEGTSVVLVGRRLTLLDHMSTLQERRDSLAGLTLDAILSDKRSMPAPPASRTLLDIIRDEDPNGKGFANKDKKSWKLFRDRLRLNRAGAAWTSSVNVPASDVPIPNANVRKNPRSQLSRRSSVRYQPNPSSNNLSESATEMTQPDDSVPTNSRPQFTRRNSTRVCLPTTSPPIPTGSIQHEEASDIPMPADSPPTRSFRPQISRHNSTRIPPSDPESEENSVDPFEVAREGTRRLAVALAEERSLSAREAVAAQEAAEAEAAAAAEAEASAEIEVSEPVAREANAAVRTEPAPVRMSLMDLLEETDRQMGVEGSRYRMDDDEEEEEDECEVEEEVEAEEVGGIEYNCCVCMVRHKGAAFIPCGHTFCRLCSRELWVQRGNCPLCNGFILEILDIF